jgi:uncharacterized alkaline shock family protein YloU
VNPLYRAILLFYALFGLLAAFVIYAFILGVPWPRALVNNLLHLQNANSIISLSLIIYVLFSLVLIWIGLKREKKKHAVVSEGSLGNIRVALNAIETLVEKVSMEQRGVKEAKAVVITIPQGIGIQVNVTVSADTNIPQMSEVLQNVVLEKVKEVTGIEVKDIRVSVEHIKASKPRVE